MGRIQNQIRESIAENRSKEAAESASEKVQQRERDGVHKWVRIGGVGNIKILCRCDVNGNLLPASIRHIKNVKQQLGIKDE